MLLLLAVRRENYEFTAGTSQDHCQRLSCCVPRPNYVPVTSASAGHHTSQGDKYCQGNPEAAWIILLRRPLLSQIDHFWHIIYISLYYSNVDKNVNIISLIWLQCNDNVAAFITILQPPSCNQTTMSGNASAITLITLNAQSRPKHSICGWVQHLTVQRDYAMLSPIRQSDIPALPPLQRDLDIPSNTGNVEFDAAVQNPSMKRRKNKRKGGLPWLLQSKMTMKGWSVAAVTASKMTKYKKKSAVNSSPRHASKTKKHEIAEDKRVYIERITVNYLIDASSYVFQINQLYSSDKLRFSGVYIGKFQVANCIKFDWTSFLPMTMRLYWSERILKYWGRSMWSCITQGQQMWW